MDQDLIRHRYAAEIGAAMASWDGRPARWGVDDCALAICNIDRLVMRRDPAKGYRGRYYSEAGARRVLGTGGLAAFLPRLARRLKWRRIAKIADARDGDRGLARTVAGHHCVIRLGGFWVGRYDRGNVLVTNDAVLRAWSVF